MTQQATFQVRLVDGAVRVRRADGRDITPDEAVALRDFISHAVQTRAQQELPKEKRRQLAKPYPYDPDELVAVVVAEQQRQYISNGYVSTMIGKDRSMLSHYASGKARVSLTIFNLWAYIVGLEVMLIPKQLRDQVLALIAEFKAKERANIGHPDETE